MCYRVMLFELEKMNKARLTRAVKVTRCGSFCHGAETWMSIAVKAKEQP